MSAFDATPGAVEITSINGGWWAAFNEQGEPVGRGNGSVSDADYYLVVRRNTAAELDAIDFIADKILRENAQLELTITNAQRDSQVYVEKTQEARAYIAANQLTAAQEAALDLSDPDIIDPVLYEYLYAEYWSAFDLPTGPSPLELCRQIIAKASKSAAEGRRRRKKLQAMATLNAETPPVPTE